MQKYLVVAHFEVQDGSFDRFIKEAAIVAESSLREELGCERYDVLVHSGGKRNGTLYEVYAQKSDHDAHREKPYFQNFWTAISDMKVQWVVEFGELDRQNEFTTPR